MAGIVVIDWAISAFTFSDLRIPRNTWIGGVVALGDIIQYSVVLESLIDKSISGPTIVGKETQCSLQNSLKLGNTRVPVVLLATSIVSIENIQRRHFFSLVGR